MANTYDTNVKLQAIATAITNAATSDPNLLAKLQAIADAITNGGGGGSVTASNVSVVPTSPFVSTNLQNLSVEEANAITANAGDITTINTALGNTSISGIGDGSVTGAIATNNSNINTINTALGNTSISGIGDGSVTGAISTLNSRINTTTFSSAVNLSSYTSSANAYTFPSDGYLQLRSGDAVSDYVTLEVYGSDGSGAFDITAKTQVTNYREYNALYVRKGMKCYIIAKSGNNSTATFRGFE